MQNTDHQADKQRQNSDVLKKHQFRKGQSGNPAGRPRIGKTIPDLLRWAGKQRSPEQLAAKMRAVYNLPPDMPLTVEQTTALVVYANAMKGSIQHIQFIADRTEGKVKDVLDITENAVKLRIVEEVVRVGDNPPDKTP